MMVVARSTIVENLVWEIDYFPWFLQKKYYPESAEVG